MQWKCTKLICFEWQCNLFEIVQVLETWELRRFYWESFFRGALRNSSFSCIHEFKNHQLKKYISLILRRNSIVNKIQYQSCTLSSPLYPACFNIWKVIYGMGSLCRESSCNASVASEEVADFTTGVVCMQLLLAIEARQPIYSCKKSIFQSLINTNTASYSKA